MNAMKGWIYRHRRYGKQWLGVAGRVLPAPLARRLRALAEQVAFRVVPEYQADTLPAIFDYWAARHVSPLAERIGVNSPEDLFYTQARAIGLNRGCVSIASIGSGACSLELSLLHRLRADGIDARMHCVDFNASLTRRAKHEAELRGLDTWFTMESFDCNRPFAFGSTDVIIVNQFLHHVESLEVFAESLRASLAPDGVLLTSDVVGRNGHRLWPSVDRIVQSFWERLPEARRFDRYFSRSTERYVPIDHAAYSNEGIRSQDVVASLLTQFDFERFLTFGGAIIPFVERRIGFNFDRGNASDTAFIDELATLDHARIEAGDYPASNMIAMLRHKGQVQEPRLFVPVSPEQHVAATQRQMALC